LFGGLKIINIFVDIKLFVMSENKIKVLNESVEREFDVKETLTLLGANRIWLWSWGSRNFTQFENKALFFTVSGNHHKGIVLITLAWNDTYTVRFLSNRWNVKSVVTDVFFDELAEVIDDKVERIGVYEF
jgi:hypothetical protein